MRGTWGIQVGLLIVLTLGYLRNSDVVLVKRVVYLHVRWCVMEISSDMVRLNEWCTVYLLFIL